MKKMDGESSNRIKATEKFYTTTEAAKLVNLSTSTLFRAIRNKNIKAFSTPGGHFRITRQALEEFSKVNEIPLLDLAQDRPKVLLIDSIQSDLHYMTRLLEKGFECEVKTAVSGFEAGYLLQSFHPVLVIANADSKKGNLQDILPKIKNSPQFRHTKILLLSKNKRAHFKEQLTSHILSKPLHAATFKAKIKEIL